MSQQPHMTLPFVPGLTLGRAFYEQAVAPILGRHFPDLPHAAGLLGFGSEVLGFDDPMSRDHHWGPRVMLFLPQEAHTRHAAAIDDLLRRELPVSCQGYPTNWSAPNPNDNGVQGLVPIEHGPVNHRVDLLTVPGFIRDYLHLDLAQPLIAADWLTLPMQRLCTLSAGAVFHDELGLEKVRAHFAWYPPDVWLYQLASGWARLGEEEALMGRAGLVGDEIGSALIGARLVRDVMRLCFMMERQYAPYPKWFGSAFRQLACAADLEPLLQQSLGAQSWQAREAALVPAYRIIARMHNRLGLTDPMPEEPQSYFGRPFRVIAQQGFAEALVKAIQDPALQQLAKQPLIGSIDLFSDSTALCENLTRQAQVRTMYT